MYNKLRHKRFTAAEKKAAKSKFKKYKNNSPFKFQEGRRKLLYQLATSPTPDFQISVVVTNNGL